MRSGVLLLALALAACSGGGQPDYNASGELSEKDARAARAIEQAAANGPAAVAKGVPVETPTPGVDRSRVLPTAFQGYWGITPRDCELANVGATGRLFIDGDTLRFYESKATVEQLPQSSPTSAVAILAYKGEGERWTRRTTLTLTAGGTRLTRIHDGEPAVTYQHC